MEFRGAIASGFRRYVDFEGRSSRAEYWYWALFTFLCSGLAFIVDAFTTGFLLYTLFAIVTFLPSWGVTVRRLHDVDRTGWWVLISFVPILGAVLLLAWFLSEGTPRSNRYGSSPFSNIELAGAEADCPRCGATRTGEGEVCESCGENIPFAEPVAATTTRLSSTRFLTPAVGVGIGLLFAFVFMQVTFVEVPDSAWGGYGRPPGAPPMEEQLGMNTSPVMMWPWNTDLSTMLDQKQVRRLMSDRWSITLELLFIGGGLAVVTGWAVGLLLNASGRSSPVPKIVVGGLSSLVVAWLCLVLVWLFVMQLDWLPLGRYEKFSESPSEHIKRIILPVFAIGITGGIWIALDLRVRLGKSASELFVSATGLVLRNAGILIASVIVVELIFVIPGLGLLFVQGINNLDSPVIGATAAAFVWIALIAKLFGNVVLSATEKPRNESAVSGQESRLPRPLIIAVTVSAVLLALLFILPFAAPLDPVEQDLRSRFAGPGADFVFGADHLGRDVFSRILHAGRSAAAIALPIAILAVLAGAVMFGVRGTVNRSASQPVRYATEGVLEGFLSVPWLIVGIMVQLNVESTWPLLALGIIIFPRAMRVGWTLGANSGPSRLPSVSAMAQMFAMFLAASVLLLTALGFLGFALQSPTAEFGIDISDGRPYLDQAARTAILPGIAVLLIAGTWLAMAALVSRSGQSDEKPLGLATTMS